MINASPTACIETISLRYGERGGGGIPLSAVNENKQRTDDVSYHQWKQ